jgi:hypothetical protein
VNNSVLIEHVASAAPLETRTFASTSRATRMGTNPREVFAGDCLREDGGEEGTGQEGGQVGQEAKRKGGTE